MKNQPKPQPPATAPVPPSKILLAPQHLLLQIRRKKEDLAALTSQAEHCTAMYGEISHGGSSDSRSRVEDFAVRAEGIRRQLLTLQDRYDRALLDAEILLESLPDATCASVLRLTYLEGLSGAAAAHRLNFCTRYVERLKRRGLAALKAMEAQPAPAGAPAQADRPPDAA